MCQNMEDISPHHPLSNFRSIYPWHPKCWCALDRNTWCQTNGIAWLLSHPSQSPIEPGRGEIGCIAKSWRLMAPAASKHPYLHANHLIRMENRECLPRISVSASLMSTAICTAKAKSRRSQRNQQSHDKNSDPQTK